jgi:Protein of unknown function (DUF1592)/Protein of unknown function (DUF1588)/Protein of unknown function (DUF1587)/Protein of unknown function (DUF1585)/Protein of unknown function (DUF1595)/Ca-dependent carbohydrate-binding module xylan-binding
MSRLFSFYLASALLAVPVAAPAQAPAAKGFAKDILPVMQKYCWDCHGDGAHKGELNFDKYLDEKSVVADRKIWAGVLFHIDQWTMPPAKKSEQPTAQERDFLTKYLDQLLNPVDAANPDPGRVTIRRLNRVEYNNTMRDLLGVDIRPADDFPEDDTGYGFDNIGDVLALPPILMERYLTAADRVLNAAIPPPPPEPALAAFPGKDLTGQGFEDDGGRLLAFNGECGTEFSAPVGGEYVVRAKVWASPGGSERAKIDLTSGTRVISKADVSAADRGKPQTVEGTVKLAKGGNRIGVRFLNDFYDPNAPDPAKADRNLWVTAMEVEGPFKVDPLPLNETARRIFTPGAALGDNEAGARAILQQFANRCYRRAALPAEVDRLLTIYKMARGRGEPHPGALRVAMKAIMISPYFIYRMEWQPEANNRSKVVDIDDFALATRLSYWLWSSTPDDELLSLSFRKQLRPNLNAQVLRMLQDPKARALAENFGGQWLELRTLNVAAPDKDRFPDYTPELAKAMRQETEEFFHNIVRENRSVLEFLSGGYTFLNERLAKYYGITGISGDQFRKVDLDPKYQRSGVLTHASVLTVTSDPTRTSPVKRGKWVLENLLGITPPPPPPNVPALEEGGHGELTGSVRQRLEAHRSKPGCASCHALMDPIGFGLENFNAIGQWRDKDGSFPVDSAGVLTTGQKFSNAGELSKILLTDRRDAFLHALVNKMLTYALGRGTEAYDRPAVEAILARMAKENNSFQSLVLGISESLPFQKRRGDVPR